MDLYVLRARVVVPAVSVREWGECFGSGERIVAQSEFGGVRVSTVFLGVDHRYGAGPPLVFETMVFGGLLDGEQERCSTWAEAEAMHGRVCGAVEAAR